MPLLDHFHPPLYPLRHWESFHAQWAGAIAGLINEKLRPSVDYFAEVQVHIGSRVEVDVATLHDQPLLSGSRPAADNGGGVATLPAPPWAPPAPDLSMPAIFPDSIEVLVFNSMGGATLVGAIELVSPGNKDRADFRRGFAAKCAAYLQQGVGLVVVDIVTDRRGNLHNELVDLLGVGQQFVLGEQQLYVVSYRAIRRPEAERIDVWNAALALGQTFPRVPLWLDRGICLPLELEPPYMEACQRSGLM